MNIEYLKTYLEVIKLGSFSEVAKRMSISQPAVSFQIQKLERDLGVRLLDRSQKTITLTDAGKRLLRFAETVDREQALLPRLPPATLLVLIHAGPELGRFPAADALFTEFFPLGQDEILLVGCIIPDVQGSGIFIPIGVKFLAVALISNYRSFGEGAQESLLLGHILIYLPLFKPRLFQQIFDPHLLL